MNPDNYASLEASKRLEDAGIVLETDFYWVKEKTNEADYYELMLRIEDRFLPVIPSYYSSHSVKNCDSVPAPSMAEVWRELPGETRIGNRWLLKHLHQDQVFTYAEYCGYEDHALAKQCQNTNPTDALIDLLIWVRKGRCCNTCKLHNNDGTCCECAGDNYGHATEISGNWYCKNWQVKEASNGKS